MCKSTIRNYGERVTSAGGKEVSKEQKQAAFPGLVKLGRQQILEHPTLGPEDALKRSEHDVQFLKQIDTFMKAQTGFQNSSVDQQPLECVD